MRNKEIKRIIRGLEVLDTIESYYMIYGEPCSTVRNVIDSGERLLSILNSGKGKITDVESPFIEIYNKWVFNEIVKYNEIKIARVIVKSLIKNI